MKQNICKSDRPTDFIRMDKLSRVGITGRNVADKKMALAQYETLY